MNAFSKHWRRLKRSLSQRYREWRLPRGYIHLGTRYGGWWIDRHLIGPDPLLVDCGLGRDISFPAEFLSRFRGRVLGIDPNPDSVAFCREHAVQGMEICQKAFWKRAGEVLRFNLPRPKELLPKGADEISGSLLSSYTYNSSEQVEVTSTSLAQLLEKAGREECDVLKMDIEGAEHEVLRELCADGSIRRARQLLVESHDFCTEYGPEDTREAVLALARIGFMLVHRENHNYIFRRTDIA